MKRASKPIRYEPHAQQRMEERGITTDRVERTIERTACRPSSQENWLPARGTQILEAKTPGSNYRGNKVGDLDHFSVLDVTMIQKVGFELSISGRDDGTIEAAYIHLTDRKIRRTKEIVEDVLLADYSSDGTLVGIEILAPVKISQLTRLVERPKRQSFKRFLKQSAPVELVR